MVQQSAVLSDVTIRLPKTVADFVSAKEIIGLLADKALSKAEYYQSRCREMERKYGVNFSEFKKKVDGSEKEVFSEWDDLIVWEGYSAGHKEWAIKYRELKSCII